MHAGWEKPKANSPSNRCLLGYFIGPLISPFAPRAPSRYHPCDFLAVFLEASENKQQPCQRVRFPVPCPQSCAVLCKASRPAFGVKQLPQDRAMTLSEALSDWVLCPWQGSYSQGSSRSPREHHEQGSKQVARTRGIQDEAEYRDTGEVSWGTWYRCAFAN